LKLDIEEAVAILRARHHTGFEAAEDTVAIAGNEAVGHVT
jgi:hypothetical protein